MEVAPYLLKDVHRISVALIGCGGSGSFMLTVLARINYALIKMGQRGLFVTVYDFDKVEEMNIGRQAFNVSDIGLNKAAVSVERINQAFGSDWTYCDHKVSRHNTSLHYNLVISCVDSISSRKHIRTIFNRKTLLHDFEKKFYWMDLGNGKDFGQIFLADNETLPNIFNLYPRIRDNKDSGPSCGMLEALNKQSLFINSTLTQLAGDMLFKMLTTGKIEHPQIYLNLKTTQVQGGNKVITKS